VNVFHALKNNEEFIGGTSHSIKVEIPTPFPAPLVESPKRGGAKPQNTEAPTIQPVASLYNSMSSRNMDRFGCNGCHDLYVSRGGWYRACRRNPLAPGVYDSLASMFFRGCGNAASGEGGA
jgi:hypothetical protein